jgi:hypothetical protein
LRIVAIGLVGVPPGVEAFAPSGAILWDFYSIGYVQLWAMALAAFPGHRQGPAGV